MGARALVATMSLAFVGSVYIFPGGRARDDSAGVILRRMLGVSILTAFTVYNFGYDLRKWFLTFDASTLADVGRAMVILHLLYFVPLVASGGPDLSDYRPPPKATKEMKKQKLFMVLKNIVVGPATEELVYRGVILAIYRANGLSDGAFLRENSIYFALAHVHHAVMRYLDGFVSFKLALVQAIMHFIMTSLFGLYSSYWLLQTGTIWPSIALHAVCNLYGPPAVTRSKVFTILSAVGAALFFYSVKFI